MSKATTKFAIAFAFKELLLEKSIDKITINDITEGDEGGSETDHRKIECIDSGIFRTCTE